MANTPLNSVRYPISSSQPNANQDMQNLALDLEDNTFAGPFASTTARDTAFTNWVALGNSMRDGLHCHVTGVGDMVYISSNWHIQNTSTLVQSGRVAANIGSGASSSTGTVTFPFAFSSAPIVTPGVESLTGGVDIIADLTAVPTTTGCAFRLRERSATNGPYTANFTWVAVGVA